ncbi:MAG: DUF1848 domain-containing protein [Deltaproteobacteria bacterium]|nr:DUF1848 domain-containing protein [Deltaproteobacteria bacterium]
MIISCSRRTDIPAFFTPWLMQQIANGFCEVANPFNPKQISRISLNPEDVDVIVFWTKNAAPLLPYLSKLNQRGFAYYFLYTITGYGPAIEPHVPAIDASFKTYHKLAELIGPERVIWRYDPIIFSEQLNQKFHQQNFTHIAKHLHGYSKRVIISFVDHHYRHANKGLATINSIDTHLQINKSISSTIAQIATNLAAIAGDNALDIYSCSETLDLNANGIKAGSCIDAELIHKLFNKQVSSKKDPYQRSQCNCVKSRDIGAYNTCSHGCIYCYATSSNKPQSSINSVKQ